MMQTAFRIGDNVTLRITTDNRACEKPLKPVQVKLSMRGNLLLREDITIKTNIVMIEGKPCPAKEQLVQEITFKIPENFVCDNIHTNSHYFTIPD